MYTSTKLDHYPGYPYMPQVNPARTGNLRNENDDKYVVTTKIMVLALAVLFAVVFFVICLHIYAKWIWRTNPARGPVSFSFWPRRRRNRDSAGDEIVLDAEVLDINMVVGLGKSAVEALPKFRYKMADHLKSTEIGELECAICLGKFEEDEMGRALPKCGHTFHLECIDMWLYSHSTCPLCRAILEPDEDESISLKFETPGIQVFHLEPMSTPRRLRGTDLDQNTLPQLAQRDQIDEPFTESEQPSQPRQDQDTANKRADSIPPNVLFWGNHTQQSPHADSRLSTVINTSPQTPSQFVIDIDIDLREHDQHAAVHHDNIPTASPSNSAVAPMSRTSANFHRLLGRARLPASPAATSTSAEDVNDMSARPSP